MSEHESRAGNDTRDDDLVDVSAAHTNGSDPGASPDAIEQESIEREAAATSPSPGDDDGAAFLADLARAMQATAAAEHVRISDEAERRQEAQVEGIRARAEIEADGLRANAEQDVAGIDVWAEGEIERVQRERERRIAARRQALETHLERHKSLVEREVEGVEAAVGAYRSDVDAVFLQLSAEPDPATIGRLARSRPPFPPLDEVGAAARARAMAELGSGAVEAPRDVETPTAGEGVVAVQAEETADEGRLVGVMESPAAVAGELRWPTPSDAERESAMSAILEGARASEAQKVAPAAVETSADAVEAAADAVGTSADPGEAPAEAVPVTPRSSGALLESIPARRPVSSWWQRGNNQEDRSDSDR